MQFIHTKRKRRNNKQWANASLASSSAENPDMRRCLTIKAAVLQGVIQEAGVGVKGRSEDKHAGVEAVGPARIRSR